jgi:hydroxymethylpyrimidine/phosphomethylpyrimidine kinase
MRGRVLIIAGSDSGGGAGIQADIKTVTALDAFAMTAITALTAQNTEGVHEVMGVPEDFIETQMRVVLEDIGADALKTGMLHTAGVIERVTAAIDRLAPEVPLVADPVMVAKGGHRLLDEDAVASLQEKLVPRARVLTPNIPEAEVLCGASIRDADDMEQAARHLFGMGAGAVLLKGGHGEGEVLTDVLITDDGIERFEDARLVTRHTHGTGCTLASAIAAGLAQHFSVRESVARARRFVRLAMEHAPGYGHGHGPLDHAVTVDLSKLG